MERTSETRTKRSNWNTRNETEREEEEEEEENTIKTCAAAEERRTTIKDPIGSSHP
jgi:hypothetical protein